jgi:hypothetical protein
MSRYLTIGALALIGAVASLTIARSAPDPKGLPPGQCFRASDIESSVQMSETRLNILTRDHHYIRVDTAGRCFLPPYIDPYVIRIRGVDTICSPIDLDLSAGPPGFRTPCIVDKISLMSPAEVAALPKRDKP